MTLFRKPIRPAYVFLAVCLLLFAWKSAQLASMQREVASALAELQPGAPPLTLEHFIRDYLSDPFGKAIGMSRRQLQLCQQVSARVPGYEASTALRNDAVFGGLVAALYLLFQRHRSRLPIDRWRGAARGWARRLAVRMAPLLAEARRRVEEKRHGHAAPGAAAAGTVYDVVACPACGQKLRLPCGKGALRVKCSGCGTVFDCRT